MINTSDKDLRYIGISTRESPEIAEYPDSKKFGVMAGVKDGNPKSASFAHLGRAGETLDYWDGEAP